MGSGRTPERAGPVFRRVLTNDLLWSDRPGA